MMNVNSVYTNLANLASRKTVSGLITFNNLVEAGLVRFLNAKEEAEVKTVTVNVKELAEARQQAEKVLASARAVKGYRAVEVQTKVPYLDLTGVGEVYLDFLHVQSLLQERPTYPGWAIWEDFSHIQL